MVYVYQKYQKISCINQNPVWKTGRTTQLPRRRNLAQRIGFPGGGEAEKLNSETIQNLTAES